MLKKLLIVAVAALSLTACTKSQLEGFVGKVVPSFAPLTQPVTVTRAMLYDLENGFTVAVAGLNTYKRLCVQHAINQSCRDVIHGLQVNYTRKIPRLLANLRAFVRTNNQVDAVGAFTEVKSLIDDFRSQAASDGVPIN